MKYQISYTLKDTNNQGMKRELFKTKKAALLWLKENCESLYWYQLTETNPKSKKPKLIVNFELGEEYVRKTGVLQTYYETGMECLGLVFYEDSTGGTPNPNFDPLKPEDRSNFRYYSSWEHTNFLANGNILQVGDGPKVALLQDRDFASRDGYRFSFYPQGFSRSEIVELFVKETVKATLWVKKVDLKD